MARKNSTTEIVATEAPVAAKKNGKAAKKRAAPAKKALMKATNKAIARYKREYAKRRVHMDALAGDIAAQALLKLGNRLALSDKTYKELALQTGCCTATVKRLEAADTYSPRLKTFLKFAIAAGLDAEKIANPKATRAVPKLIEHGDITD